MMWKRVGSTLLFLALTAAVANAGGVVVLKDGRILEGRKMERKEKGIEVHFENGDVLIPFDLIQDLALENDTGFVPSTPEEKEKYEMGLVPFEGKWIAPDKRAELLRDRIEERKAQIEEIKAHQKWVNAWKEATKHFEFEFTVPPHVFDDYRDLMEAYYSDFAKTWKVGQPKDLGRLKVCFYTDPDAFHRTSGAPRGVLGYFRFVKPLELNFFYDRMDPRFTEEVMFHETNHYLQKLLNPEFSMPHFPGESLAEYYAASVWDPAKKKLTVGLILDGRLTEVKTDIAAGNMCDLKELITTDGDYRHYTWGWTLVHFLMNDRNYEKRFQKFVLALANGKDVDRQKSGYGTETLSSVTPAVILETFMKYLGLKSEDDLKKLEGEWHDYVQGLQVVGARGLDKAAMGALNSGRSIKAKRLFGEAIEAGSTDPRTYVRYAELLGRENEWDKAIPLLRKAIELDPLAGDSYATLGRALVRTGKAEEGKKLARLALEIDPDDLNLELEVKLLLDD